MEIRSSYPRNGYLHSFQDPIDQKPPVSLQTRNAIYSAALKILNLGDTALTDLMNRGLSRDAAMSYGYRSLPKRGSGMRKFIDQLVERFGEQVLRQCPGFTDKNGRLNFWTAYQERDGYIVPYQDELGRLTGLQARFLDGRYLTARGSVMSSVYHIAGDCGLDTDLYVTEGATKANVANYLGGPWVFSVAGQSLSPQHIRTILSLRPKRVIVALDQEDNLNTARASDRWLRAISDSGVPVYTAVWEGEGFGGFKGLDDLIYGGELPRIRPFCRIPPEIGQSRRPRPSRAVGEIDVGDSLNDVRTLTRRTVQDFFRNYRSNKGKALLLSTSPGSGKTYAVADAVSNTTAAVRIVAGTKRLAREISETFNYVLVDGRNEINCERIDVVEALAEGGHDVGSFACGTPSSPQCPFRRSCAYWKQFDRVGTRIGTTEQIFNPNFLEGGDVIVVDDAELSRAMIDRSRLNIEAMNRTLYQLGGKSWLPERRLLMVVLHAIVDAPRHESGHPGLSLIGSDAWDHLYMTARRNGYRLEELLGALPEKSGLPQPRAQSDGVVIAEDVRAVPPRTVTKLIEALTAESPIFMRGEDLNSRIRIDASGIDVWQLRECNHPFGNRSSLADMALLILDATPVDVLVGKLTKQHERLPDVRSHVKLPENVTVVRYASSSNGHAVLADPIRMQTIISEISDERMRYPVDGPNLEAAVCFRSHRRTVENLGFAPSQVLTYGSGRGSNTLANVERLHLVGRPMPPGDDLIYLAQVLHQRESPIRRQIVMETRRYGGQSYESDVVDFQDERVSSLLKACRDDEIIQMIYRARLSALDSQVCPMVDSPLSPRKSVRLVIHTSHPVPGLRVDELRFVSRRKDVNEIRRIEAEDRIMEAGRGLMQRGKEISVAAVAREAKSSWKTVSKVLGKPLHTLKHETLKGVQRLP